ncbi:MAG TPA: PelD GGDEF domain-containing protein [Polyangia bacterium]|nr:PelD GGDEF domain-containing protein [Polyangia bacterium]
MRPLLARLPLARRPVAAWVETGLLVLMVPALGLWLNPSDPLFVQAPFPWPMLAPLLAGLRYGFGPGFGAAAALVFATVAARKGILPLHVPPGELSPQRTVGLLLTGMITGEFSGLWRRRVEASETVQTHERLRFESFVRSHQALRLSHDLLESRLAGAAPTLREALRALEAAPLVDAPDPHAMAQAILNVFSTFVQVRQGAVFLAAGPDEPLAETPAALLGTAPALEDPLVQEALRDRAVVSFASALDAARAAVGPAAVVLAAPLEDVEGRLWGVLAVTELPLSAQRAETNHAARFAALAGHVADRLAFGASGRVAEERLEEDAQAFARNVRRAASNHRQHGLPSGIVRFALEGKRAPELAATIARQRRVTDRVLRTAGREGRTTVTLLLPMTDDIGRARYLGRMEGVLRELTGTSMAEAGVQVLEHAAISDFDRMGKLDLREQAAAGAGS